MESRKHYTGLTDKQVLESREKHGANVLTPRKGILYGKFSSGISKIPLFVY